MSKANFVTANAVDTILAVPRCVDKPPVNYMEKEDYGKIPKYLKQVKFCRMFAVLEPLFCSEHRTCEGEGCGHDQGAAPRDTRFRNGL